MQAISVSEARQNLKKYFDDVLVFPNGHGLLIQYGLREATRTGNFEKMSTQIVYSERNEFLFEMVSHFLTRKPFGLNPMMTIAGTKLREFISKIDSNLYHELYQS